MPLSNRVSKPRVLLLGVSLLLSARAQADAPAGAPPANGPDVENDYPSSFVQRPLILHTGDQQLFAGLQAAHNNDTLQAKGGASIASSDPVRVLLADDFGLLPQVQVGGWFSYQVEPQYQRIVESARLNIQYAMAPSWNTRLDFGLQHYQCDARAGGDVNSFTAGIGLPFKTLLTDHVALFSGSSFAPGYTDDLISWDPNDCDSFGTASLPIGIMAGIENVVTFDLRAGYRHLFGSGYEADFFPVTFDGMASLTHTLDAGFTAEWPGHIGGPASRADLQQFLLFEKKLSAWIQVRI